jgi:hypothetical protein
MTIFMHDWHLPGAGSGLALEELEEGLMMLEGELEDKELATQLMR